MGIWFTKYAQCGRSPRLARMRQKKPQHLCRCIWALRVGVAARRFAARPGVAAAVHRPLLRADRAVCAAVGGAGVAAASGGGALVGRALQRAGGGVACGGRGDLVGVARVYGAVGVAVEDDRRHGDGGPIPRRALLHGIAVQTVAGGAGAGLGGTGLGIAVRPDNKALLEKLNNALAAIKADGTYQKINDQWFPQ